MVERQYDALRRERLKGTEENRSDGPASSDSTPNSTPTPTPASLNDESQPDVMILLNNTQIHININTLYKEILISSYLYRSLIMIRSRRNLATLKNSMLK